MYSTFLPILIVLLVLALLWLPYQFLLAARQRLSRTEIPTQISLYRGLVAIGAIGIIFNFAYVFQLVIKLGSAPLSVDNGLTVALVISWAAFWGRLVILRYSRKRHVLRY